MYTCNCSIHDGFEANLGYIETLSLNTLQNYGKARTLLQENPVQAANLSMWKEIIAKAAGREIEEREVQSFLCLHPFLSHSPTVGCLVPLETEMLDSSQDFCLLSYPQDKQWKLYADTHAFPSDRIYFCVTPVQSSSVSMKPEQQH